MEEREMGNYLQQSTSSRLEPGTFAAHAKPNQPKDLQGPIPNTATCALEVGDLFHIETFNADEADI